MKKSITKFKVNDIVMISPSSEYYCDSYVNPKDEEGKIIIVENAISADELNIKVIWSNGSDNRYREEDLILVFVETPETKELDNIINQSKQLYNL